MLRKSYYNRGGLWFSLTVAKLLQAGLQQEKDQQAPIIPWWNRRNDRLLPPLLTQTTTHQQTDQHHPTTPIITVHHRVSTHTFNIPHYHYKDPQHIFNFLSGFMKSCTNILAFITTFFFNHAYILSMSVDLVCVFRKCSCDSKSSPLWMPKKKSNGHVVYKHRSR